MSVPPAVVRDAGRFFSLVDERLKLGTEGYSPVLLQKIEYAGANTSSFQQAAGALKTLAELTISPKHVQRIAERLGAERQRRRDADGAAHQARTLTPRHAEPPAVAAIHLDAGKIQRRDDAGPPGVRGPRWADTKIACCLTYAPRSGTDDPQPDPPVVFLDRPSVMRLCGEMKRVRNGSAPAAPQAAPREDASEPPPDSPEIERPQRLVRTAVATLGSAEPFGWMVAAEAKRRGFFEAAQRGILGDGAAWIWTLAATFFSGWTQTLDFLHLLTHLYDAATSAYAGDADRAWKLYVRLVNAAWAGHVTKVIDLLAAEAKRLGPPPPNAASADPRRVVAQTLEYVQRNEGRMD
jgi:hypothetical protein